MEEESRVTGGRLETLPDELAAPHKLTPDLLQTEHWDGFFI